jgi:hypothetical protein
MGSRSVALGSILFAAALGVAAACADSEPSDVPNYGPPGGIVGKSPDPPVTGGSGSGSGGGTTEDAGTAATGDGGSVGTPTTTFACQTGGTPLVDGGPCTVSWSQTIYPAMQATGAWGCAATGACHGTGNVAPNLSGTTSSSFYTVLANYTLVPGNANPFFNPCSTDPTKSTFVCNTSPTGTCGNLMPLAGGVGTMTDAGLAEIATWVACGAPQN